MTAGAGSRHRLLERQLRKSAGGRADGAPDWELLLDMVSAAYADQEESQRHNNEAIDQVSREITELNRQVREEAAARARDATRLNAILENASEAIISTDGAGLLNGFNRAAEQIFGYKAAEVLGRNVSMLFADWNSTIPKILASVVATPDSAVVLDAMEVRAKRASGEVFPCEISLSELEFEGETIRIGFHRDISGRKATEAALVAARDEAEAANTAKSEFLAAMSHEIRTPLNGVLGMAAAMEGTGLSPEQRQMLGVINESGQILMTLLSDILDLSKIEAGRMAFEAAPFHLTASVQAVARLYAETAGAKELDYAVTIDAAAGGWFVGDSTRYRQVLQNLVSNALKFTDRGGVSVAVEALEGPDGVCVVRTSVSDTGPGIAPEARGRLFRKFSQADASTTRRYGGTGLGLAISKQLVEALGGEIGVSAAAGGGALFWFSLPMARAQALQEAPATAAALSPMRSTVRILAAEDNRTNQLVLKALLANADVEVTFADNGAQAVEAASAGDFDIILMDVQMPVMDGMAAARAIRAGGGRCSMIPIVAVTADAMPEQVKLCLAAGMDAHVSKPLRPEALFSVIDEALSRQPRAAAQAGTPLPQGEGGARCVAAGG